MTRLRRWLSSTLIVVGLGLTSITLASIAGGSNDEIWFVALGVMLLTGGILARQPR
jgi:hypothetical protein